MSEMRKVFIEVEYYSKVDINDFLIHQIFLNADLFK